MIPSCRSATDPLALLDDRQALDLFVQPGVLDGDAGVAREHLDEPLVVVAEPAALACRSGTGCRPTGP